MKKLAALARSCSMLVSLAACGNAQGSASGSKSGSVSGGVEPVTLTLYSPGKEG